MIKLATPISTLFHGDDAEKEIVSLSDCLECRDHTVASNLPHQELFHFEAELIHPWDETRRSFIQSAIQAKPDLQFVTFHAASCCSAPVLEGRMYQIGGTVYTRDAMLDFAKQNVTWLRSFIPSTLEIGIENNNYYPAPAYEHVTDGEFLSEIIMQNDLRFLFDIAHARITAHNQGLTHDAYVSSLPLDRVVQLHVCRSDMDGDLAIDAHLPPGDAELSEVLELIKRHPAIQYVTLEYYKDAAILCDLLKTYRQALQG